MTAVNTNTLVLAQAIELGTAVIARVAGDAIANTVNGKIQGPTSLDQALGARMQANLARYGEKKQ